MYSRQGHHSVCLTVYLRPMQNTPTKRVIGKSNLQVAPLALGGNVFGWTIDEKQSFRILDKFVDAGFNLIDTADYYARWAGKGGESETIIGKWLQARKCRSKIVLATKVGMDVGSGPGLKKDYILQAVEKSLTRLKTDYIDLYQSHKDDPFTPVHETLEAYEQLIKSGKVSYVGASNFSPERMRESLQASQYKNLPRYECLQPHYNLCERSKFEGALEELCLQEQIGVIPYFSLASGFLTGKYRSVADTGKSVRGSGVLKYLNEKGLGILKAMDIICTKYDCRPASVAIAWLASRKSITAPIASATNEDQLHDLLRGATMQLSTEEITLLDKASNPK